MGGYASADSEGVGPLTRQQDADPIDNDQETDELELGLKVLSAVDYYSADGADERSVAMYARLPRSTARRYLQIWEQISMVERDPETGQFRIPMSRRLQTMRHRARFWLDTWRDRFDEVISFGILEGDSVHYLNTAEKDPRPVTDGRREPLHCTAVGKAIAAGLPDDQVRGILERQGMPKRTANTITTVTDFLGELAMVRALGYAIDNGENDAGIRCVAVPLVHSLPPAAFCLSAPAARLRLGAARSAATALARAVEEAMTPNDSGEFSVDDRDIDPD